MNVDDSDVASPHTRCDLLENKLLGAEDFEGRRVFRWRADQDQIIVFCIVQRKKAASLDAKILVQRAKYLVECMLGQNFADSSVVVQDWRFRVARCIEVAHAGIRPANESRVTENNPRLLRAREETLPEDAIGQGWLRCFDPGMRIVDEAYGGAIWGTRIIDEIYERAISGNSQDSRKNDSN